MKKQVLKSASEITREAVNVMFRSQLATHRAMAKKLNLVSLILEAELDAIIRREKLDDNVLSFPVKNKAKTDG